MTKVITIGIDITDGLAGYQIVINGEIKQFDELSRKEQIKVLNSFSNGYNMFIDALKDE